MRHRREERRKQEDPGREAAARKAVRRAFPGSQHDEEELRVAMERGAYADLVAHAKAFLETEVCGVLVGEVCRDETGLFVSVQAVVRGEAAVSGAASVTFTQATWNRIHETLDRDYPKQQIVGWYHTHPGFGVEFSEMDLFIQGNFFPAETQVALLTDPLSGEVAVCANGEDGTTYLRRFWVDGREHVCKVPAAAAPSTARSHVSEDGLGERIDRLEARVGQALQTLDEMRADFARFLTIVFVLVCLGIAGMLVYGIFVRRSPPEPLAYVPVPVKIGDHTMLVGVGVLGWEVPPELVALPKVRSRDKEKAPASTTKSQGGASQPANTAEKGAAR